LDEEQRDADYARRLVEVLKTRDVQKLRQFLRASAAAQDPNSVAEIDAISPEEMEVRMHKMIIARPELSELHGESRRWLAQRGKTVSY